MTIQDSTGKAKRKARRKTRMLWRSQSHLQLDLVSKVYDIVAIRDVLPKCIH